MVVAAVRRLSVVTDAVDPSFSWRSRCNPLFAFAATSGSAELGSDSSGTRHQLTDVQGSKSQLLILHVLQSSLLDQ